MKVLRRTREGILIQTNQSDRINAFNIVEDHPYTILIVDDEAPNLVVLLNLLRRYPYNVLTALSHQEALDTLERHPSIDLVILDTEMPEMSGFELCSLLREQYTLYDLPILFVTVNDSPQDNALGLRAGANDYVTKPIDEETLVSRIRTWIAVKIGFQEAIHDEFAIYQGQIKPHFLYNALSTVISLCYIDGGKAAHLLSRVSQYLRYILDMNRSTQFVPLEQELELVEIYIEIEQARFRDRFDFQCHVDEALRDRNVPSMSIKPFVENAIRHGLFEKAEHGTVSLSIVQASNQLIVTIEDDGIGMSEEKQVQLMSGHNKKRGTGTANIRSRLKAIPGADLTIHSKLGCGTKVTLHLPADLPIGGTHA